MAGKGSAASALTVAGLLLACPLADQAWAAETEDKVVLDNDTVQVTLLTSAPGEASQPNANPEAELGIVLQGGLTLTIPNGRGVLGPGAVTFLASLIPHEARNEASLPGKMRALTFKKSTEGTGR